MLIRNGTNKGRARWDIKLLYLDIGYELKETGDAFASPVIPESCLKGKWILRLR
tara:strand:+ start:3601 stop:3762 length:162 start_codon:yes stop_codon:yes gene_type:complete